MIKPESTIERWTKMKPKVAIILLNWNRADLTIECVRSLKAIDYPDHELIIVDNASTDGSADALKSRCPDVRLLVNNRNLGFAGGNNVGIRYAMGQKADYVLLLNNDTEADPRFLSELVAAAEADPKIGIAGSKIYYFSEPKRLWYAGGKVNLWKGDTHHVGENEVDAGQYDGPGDTDYVSGCAMLIRRSVLEEIGLLDERMFLYYEDSDYCMRARRHGFRVVYVPSSVVWHKVSSTTGRVKDLQLFYGTRNMLIFEKRNAGLLRLIVFMPYYFGKFVAYNAATALLTGEPGRAKTIMKAAYEGLVR
jgi:GT2 family glycosyltransferase